MLNNSQVIDLTNMSKAEAFISTIKAYEEEYGTRMNVDGRRIRATKCARTYAK